MEEMIYETIEYRGYTIKIMYDTNAESPREWDNLGTIYSNCRDYNPDGHDIDELLNDKELSVDHVWVKVYAYMHGGITIRCTPFNCVWDSGVFGFIVTSKEKAMKYCGFDKWGEEEEKKVESILVGEIETLNDYYTGSVYGFSILKEDEMIDSCYGYYGDGALKELEAECKGIIDNIAREYRRDRIEYLRKRVKEKGRQLCLPMF